MTHVRAALPLAIVAACVPITVLEFSPDPVALVQGEAATFASTSGPLPGTSSDYRLQVSLVPDPGAAIDVRLLALSDGPLGGPVFLLTTLPDTPTGTYDMQLELAGPDGAYAGTLQLAVTARNDTFFDGGHFEPGVDAGSAPSPSFDAGEDHPDDPDAFDAGPGPGAFDGG